MTKRIEFIYGITDKNPIGDLFPSYRIIEDETDEDDIHGGNADLCVEAGCPCA